MSLLDPRNLTMINVSCGAALTHVSEGPVMSGGLQHVLRQQAQEIRRKVRLGKVADLIR
jgi:hypothetical protein